MWEWILELLGIGGDTASANGSGDNETNPGADPNG